MTCTNLTLTPMGLTDTFYLLALHLLTTMVVNAYIVNLLSHQHN